MHISNMAMRKIVGAETCLRSIRYVESEERGGGSGVRGETP